MTHQRTEDQLEDSGWSSNLFFFYGDTMKQETKEKLLEQLKALKIFPNNNHVKQLRKQIREKLKRLDKKQEKPKEKPKNDPNKARSGKLKRYHNYIRQIRNNFPNLSYNQIRSQLKKRKEGQDVSIPDVIWQNPSP